MHRKKSTIWREIVITPIHIYKVIISPVIKPRCIYYPSCSEYFERSVAKYGICRGSIKGMHRILRCNPFAAGGYDPP